MGYVEALVLIAVAVVMVFLGRPKGPVSPFIQVYIVGQIYVMTAMLFLVIGTAFLIIGWPF